MSVSESSSHVMEKDAEPVTVRIDRIQLARALLEYDESSSGPSKRVLGSAVLSPFKHILSPPTSPNASRTVPSAHYSPSLSDTPSRSAHNTVARSEREEEPVVDRLQRRYSRSIAATELLDEPEVQPGLAPAESGQADEEEERLAEQWGLGDYLSQLGSPKTPGTPGSRDIEFPFPTAKEASDKFDTRSLPDLLQAEPLLEMGRLSVRDGRPESERDRTRSLNAATMLDFPDFDAPTTRRPSFTASLTGTEVLSRPLSGASFLSDTYSTHVVPPRTATNTSRPSSALSMNRMGARTSFDSKLELDPHRPPSSFTSRFDPAMIEMARRELEAERPVFQNKEAGGPPRLVVLPAPLAGRPPSPPRRERVEGPEPEEAPEETQEAVELSHNGKPIRPAGALYGRSLMDVLAERKALNKGQARQHTAGQDGRRPMTDWEGTPAYDALHASHAADDSTPLPKSRSTMSVFGPDLLFQRDMQRRRAEEEVEAKEKEEQDRRQAELDEKNRLKKEGKLLKKRKVLARDAATRKLEGTTGSSPQTLPTSPSTSSDYALPESPIEVPSFRRQHSTAPSLSLPSNLQSTSLVSDPWFAPPSPQAGDSSSSDEDDTPRSFGRPSTQIARPSVQSERRVEQSTDAWPVRGALSASEDSNRLRSGESHPDSHGGPLLDEALAPALPNPPLLRIDVRSPSLSLSFERDPTVSGMVYSATKRAEAASDSDEDVPLGLKLYGIAVDADEDDVPLAVRRMTLSPRQAEADEDEDDRPLGLAAASLAQSYQSQAMYLAQQQQMAAMMQYQQSLATSGSVIGGAFGGAASAASSSVDQWRRSVM